VPIDPVRAAAEHAAYERTLESLGCRVEHIDPAPEHPDGVFVEDAAIVLDEVAVITRPGAESRRGETESVARALQRYRPLRHMQEPATLDGGDVLLAGRTLFVGRTERTNDHGVAALRGFVSPFGYAVVPVSVRECLHLKTAATAIDDDTILINSKCVDRKSFAGFEVLDVDRREPFAANVMRVGETLVMAATHTATRAMLERRGYRVAAADIAEMQKAEGGVTCCCLLVS
jgi:dimethylargininase